MKINEGIFKAYDIRGKVGSELNADSVRAIARAVADYLDGDEIVAVGRDMRPESEELAGAFIEGLRKQGRDVWDLGLVSTDMLYWTVANFGLDGGAMITASHNPGEYNGIKLCARDAVPIGIDSGLATIRDAVLNDGFEPADSPEVVKEEGVEEEVLEGTVKQRDVSGDWIKHLLGYVDASKLKPFNIAIDAGNGMTGMIIPKLEPHLPVKITPMYFELDGTFPNHEANPQKLETLEDISKMIVDKGLDFGIAFDGDGDRVAFIDEHGVPVPGSMTFALLAVAVLEKNPGATIAYDMRISWSALDLIRAKKGNLVRTKAGNPYVKAGMREEDGIFGGEITGHFMFADNYCIDSGLTAGMVVLEYLSTHNTTLGQFVEEYDVYHHIKETNFEINDKQAAMERLADTFKDAKVDWLDGVTVFFDDAWFNARPSNTEPLLRLNVEAKHEDRLTELVKEVTDVLKNCS